MTNQSTSTSTRSASPLADRLGRVVLGYSLRSELCGVVMLGFVALLVAALAPHIAPDTVLRHLDQGRLHIGFGFLACSLAFMVLGALVRAAISGVIGLALTATIVSFLFAATPQAGADLDSDFDLISFNVLGFNPRGAELAEFFIERAPDVALVLEAPALHAQMGAMRAAFPYNAGCGPGSRCDMALFSRHPLSNVQVLPFFSIPGRLIVARVELDAGPVTLVAAHLTKPYYGASHDQQLARLVAILAEIEGPVVLAGDFNSQPFVAPFANALLRNSQMQLASSMQPTWPAFSTPALNVLGFAIDHVLVRGAVTPISVTALDDPLGSNHRGLVSRFDLNGL